MLLQIFKGILVRANFPWILNHTRISAGVVIICFLLLFLVLMTMSITVVLQ